MLGVLPIVFVLGVAEPPPVAEPLEAPAEDAPASSEPAVAAPFEPTETPAPDPEAPEPAVATPLEPGDDTPPIPDRKPARGPKPLPDRKTARIVRASLMIGPVFRVRPVDPLIAAGVEYGRMHGFSGAFHATLVPVLRNRGAGVPAVTEATMGLGAVLRGRLKHRPLFGSVALTAGIRIHRAATDNGVLHRIDPDFGVPVQLAWTIRGIGLSVAAVQGYSVRARSYERRGTVVWRRSAYRVGLLFGLHWDVIVHRQGVRARKR